MKFYSDEPNLHIVRQRDRGNGTEGYLLCKFDENGELESNDSEVIRQLQNIYRHEENEEQKIEEPQIKMMKCKHCSFETENKGELLAHYREHKKNS